MYLLQHLPENEKNFPKNFPPKNLGKNLAKTMAKIKSSVKIRKDQPNKNGTCSLYIYLHSKGTAKKVFLGLQVLPKQFDEDKGRVKGNTAFAKDANLIIENELAKIYQIELHYRIANKPIDLQTLVNELNNPMPKYDFIQFWEAQMEFQKQLLKASTYRQQKAALQKLKKYKEVIPFNTIDEHFIKNLEMWCKNNQKNLPATISTFLKNIKKYLHIANKQGIYTAINFTDVKVKSFKSNRTYLDKHELQLIDAYYYSDFIPKHHQLTLKRFLFACFTSLRISDILKITRENIINNELVYVSEKTQKINKIKLNHTALRYLNKEGDLFSDTFTPEYINRTLKEIATYLGITKKITFHVSRHTFATMFLIQGGSVVNLQKILDHSNIRETMIYVHIVDAALNDEISLMDNILC